MKALAFLATLAFATLAFATSPLLAADDAWKTDLPKALEQAKSEKKMVLIDFTGSDWCPPCKALHSNVLVSSEFTKFAKDNLVLVELDFPRTKQISAELKTANQELAKKYGIRGYPTIIVLDGEGKELFRKVGYGGTPAADYVAELAKLKK
jgi:thiol-disulfide isomerase/thioredoxin